jgi:hypothetical protein
MPANPTSPAAEREANRRYYWNSLREWRDDLNTRHRRLMARYAAMERMVHPDKRDQGRLIELNSEMIRFINKALAERTPPPPRALSGDDA